MLSVRVSLSPLRCYFHRPVPGASGVGMTPAPSLSGEEGEKRSAWWGSGSTSTLSQESQGAAVGREKERAGACLRRSTEKSTRREKGKAECQI